MKTPQELFYYNTYRKLNVTQSWNSWNYKE